MKKGEMGLDMACYSCSFTIIWFLDTKLPKIKSLTGIKMEKEQQKTQQKTKKLKQT